LCAQNVLDLATHLVASRGVDPTSYGDAVAQLGNLGILPAEFARELRKMAGFRNVVVHGYLDLDVEKLHYVLNHHLDDFVRFAELVERALEA
jgi:uncharacterized protein YutE (UPF0331/DUF86 family)